jgi:hypothetical protein
MMRRNRYGGRFLGNRRGQGNLFSRYSETNWWLDMGDYEGAATLLERLARDSEMRHPRATPRLWLEAGQARLLAGQTPAALKSFHQGLDLLIEQQRWCALKCSNG